MVAAAGNDSADLDHDGTRFKFCNAVHVICVAATGTSFAAAATSGLAALLVSRMGRGHPDQIRAAIEQSADDLGPPGTDPYYGKGRINVARALGLVDRPRP